MKLPQEMQGRAIQTATNQYTIAVYVMHRIVTKQRKDALRRKTIGGNLTFQS